MIQSSKNSLLFANLHHRRKENNTSLAVSFGIDLFLKSGVFFMGLLLVFGKTINIYLACVFILYFIFAYVPTIRFHSFLRDFVIRCTDSYTSWYFCYAKSYFFHLMSYTFITLFLCILIPTLIIFQLDLLS